jgi:uncharacterized membrane protein
VTTQVPVDVVVAAYHNEQGANNALKELETAKKDGLIGIQDAAVLRKDDQSKLHITETADKGFGRGAMVGGVAGAVVGVIAGPVGWAALGGAAIGGLASKLRDTGFRDERLRQMGEGLQPGTSAIVAVVEHEWVREVEKRIENEAKDIVTEAITADIADQLEHERNRMEQSGTEMPRKEGGDMPGNAGTSGGTPAL